MMGTMEFATTSLPDISFCFESIENNKYNFQVDASVLESLTEHTVLNKPKLGKHLCKIPLFLTKLQIMMSLVLY